MGIRRNLGKAYTFSFFWMFLIVIPVLVPYYETLGLTMANVFQLQAAFGLAVMLLEVPTGYVCDRIGRKRTLCSGAFLGAIAFTYLIWARSFGTMLIFELIVAGAMALVSGADVSFIYDTLEAGTGKSRRNLAALANLQLSQVSGEATASILGGLLALLSFRHVLVANAITSWIPFFIALSFDEPKYEKMAETSHWNSLRTVARHVLARDPETRLLFLNLVVWGLSTFFAVWILQKDWQGRHIGLGWFGLIWATFTITTGITGKQVRRIERRFGARPLLVFLALAPVAAYFGMALIGGWAGAACGLLFYMSRGICYVLLREAFNGRVPGKFRATANSMQTGCFRLGFAIFGPIVGAVIDRVGVKTALLDLGVVFLGFYFVLMLPLVRNPRIITRH